MIRAEEVTSSFERKPIHINASNVAEYIEPRSGNSPGRGHASKRLMQFSSRENGSSSV